MATSSEVFSLLAFPSDLGWVSMWVNAGEVARLEFGFSSLSDLLQSGRQEPTKPGVIESEWVGRIQGYLNGENVDLSPISLDWSGLSPFQMRVLKQCQQIPYGLTTTYGQLAKAAGSPGAARAVGSAMARNRIPLLVPCHRVLPANGLGQYSAGSGVHTKKKLLQMEGAWELDLFC